MLRCVAGGIRQPVPSLGLVCAVHKLPKVPYSCLAKTATLITDCESYVLVTMLKHACDLWQLIITACANCMMFHHCTARIFEDLIQHVEDDLRHERERPRL